MIWFSKEIKKMVGPGGQYTQVLGTRDYDKAGHTSSGETHCPICGEEDTYYLQYSTYEIPDYYCCRCRAWYTKDEVYAGDAMSRIKVPS